MARFGALLTNYGNAAITRAFLTGTMVDVVDFALGDGGGGPYTPTPDMTGLRRETWRTAVSHGEIDPDKPNEVVFYAILPPELDIGYIREMAVFDDKGYMVAIANTPEVEKVSFEEGAGLDAVLSMAVEVVHAEVVKYEVNPYTIISTKQDLEKHNTSGTAHQGIRDELELNATSLQGLNQTVSDNQVAVETALSNKANKNDLATVQATANAAMPKSGGTFSGHVQSSAFNRGATSFPFRGILVQTAGQVGVDTDRILFRRKI